MPSKCPIFVYSYEIGHISKPAAKPSATNCHNLQPPFGLNSTVA